MRKAEWEQLKAQQRDECEATTNNIRKKCSVVAVPADEST